MGRHQRLGCAGLLRGSAQPPAAGDRRLARVRPDRGVWGDVARTWPLALPRRNAPCGPWRPLLCQHRLQRRSPLPLQPGTAHGLRLPWGRGRREGRLQPQPRQHTGTGQRRDLVQPLPRCQTAVGHTDAGTARSPAPYEAEHLPGALRQGGMAAAARRIAALGGTQDRQQGERPDAVGPRAGAQPHTREPAPATHFATVRLGGAHGVTGEAWRLALLAASTCDGVLQADHDDTPGEAHRDPESEPQATGGKRRPHGPVQDAMRRLKVRRSAAAPALEPRGHCPLARGKDGASAEDLHVLPNRSRKDGDADANDTAKGDRQGEHGPPCRTKRT